ncbi:hypothetical protein VaNZ11_010225, partial [Volvox africanus]
PICGGYRRDGCHGMWKRFLAALYNGSGDVGFGGKDGATSGHADHTRVSASVPGVESIISRTEFDSGSALDWNGKQNPPPTWVQSGDLRLAGAWGCVGASFMAEERGVPLMRVADFQVCARLRWLLQKGRGLDKTICTVKGHCLFKSIMLGTRDGLVVYIYRGIWWQRKFGFF